MRLSPALTAKVLKLAGENPVRRKRTAPVQRSFPPARWSFVLSVPMTVRSEANVRQHWTKKNRRKVEQQTALLAAFLDSPWKIAFPHTLPVVVTLTHIGRQMDTDNLANGFKGARDWIAGAILGVDDGDPRVTWRYEQRPGKPGVELRIEKEG